MIEELLHLLGDPAHWAFEGITDLAFGGAAALLLRPLWTRWHARHDREVHGVRKPVQILSEERLSWGPRRSIEESLPYLQCDCGKHTSQ